MRGRALAKAAVERLLAGGIARVADRRNRGRVAVLAYHNIVPEGERPAGDRSLHLPIATFRDHLDVIEEHHDVVPLADIGEGHESSRPRVALTFDDAYAGAVQAGLPELGRRGLPATVFVTTGMLGRRTFWWDRLAAPEGGLHAGVREHALWALRGDDEAVAAWAADEGLPQQELPEHARSATEEALRAATSGGATLAAHGWKHRNLAALDPAALDLELSLPAEWLNANFGVASPAIAYPYGLSSDRVHAAAARYCERAFRIEGGLLGAAELSSVPRALPRINVPAGLSPRGLRLRTSGVRTG